LENSSSDHNDDLPTSLNSKRAKDGRTRKQTAYKRLRKSSPRNDNHNRELSSERAHEIDPEIHRKMDLRDDWEDVAYVNRLKFHMAGKYTESYDKMHWHRHPQEIRMINSHPFQNAKVHISKPISGG
jgi:hypothetical protein